MKQSIKYEPTNEGHIKAAVELVLSAYQEERMAVPFLPDEQDFVCKIQSLIANLFIKGNGIAAICNNELIGFLAGFEREELWGKCKGIYSPLYGHGAMKENRRSIYQGIYQQAAEQWVKNSYTTHAITFFAHDQATIETWFWLGFGNRCVDAIRQVSPLNFSHPSIRIEKADVSHVPALAEIERVFHLYFRSSPMFMPRVEEDPIQALTEWLIQHNHHLWVAYRDGKPVGHMSIQPDAETFVSEHETVMNITGAYVVDEERHSGVGGLLLGAIQHWLSQNGYPLCGVDFESFNTAGSKFWNKYFTPYTYSLVRRIDERIL